VLINDSPQSRVLALQEVQEMVSESHKAVQSIEQSEDSEGKRMELIDRVKPEVY
jgi:hypothetical protein